MISNVHNYECGEGKLEAPPLLFPAPLLNLGQLRKLLPKLLCTCLLYVLGCLLRCLVAEIHSVHGLYPLIVNER